MSSKSDQSDESKIRRMIVREVKKISSPPVAVKSSGIKASKYRNDDDDVCDISTYLF